MNRQDILTLYDYNASTGHSSTATRRETCAPCRWLIACNTS